MRLRHIRGAEETIAESPYVIQDPQGLKGKWHEFFGNDNPIRIEVGTRFLATTTPSRSK